MGVEWPAEGGPPEEGESSAKGSEEEAEEGLGGARGGIHDAGAARGPLEDVADDGGEDGPPARRAESRPVSMGGGAPRTRRP